MGWWPFGRKRRKTDQHTYTVESKTIGTPYNPHTIPASREEKEQPHLNPFSDNQQIQTHIPSHQVRKELSFQQLSTTGYPSTPKQNRRSASAEIIRSSPIRRNIEKSPHLRPVPESGLGRSSSLRSLKTSSESSLFRQLSSKRRKEDRIREVQLRTSSSVMPTPKRVSEELGEPSRSNSKRYRTGYPSNPQNRNSTISVGPTTTSANSKMASISDHLFNIGPFDVLSPHPKIRQSFQTTRLNTANSTRPDTAGSYSKRTLEESRTVDDLADGFDAGTLRQLMERDQRRKERKKKVEEDKARRKLQQHKEKMRAPTVVMNESSRNRFDQQTPAVAGPSTPLRRRKSKENEMVMRSAPTQTTYPPRDPFADPDTARSSIQLRPTTPAGDIRMLLEDPIASAPQTIRYSQASMSPPSSPRYHARNTSSMSGIPDLRIRPSQEMSETSGRRSGPLAALFRRSVSGMMGGEDRKPSEGTFSNTSRESMSRQLPPSHLRERPATPKTPVNAPLRTKSRFIEDLPELPLSPPDSRMQSPILPEQRDVASLPPLPPIVPVRNQLESSPLDRTDSRTDSYDSAALTTEATILSQSLASVDSEASWLSGKPSRLLKQKSIGLLHAAKRPTVAGLSEEAGTEVEMYRRLSIPPRNPARNRVSAIRAGLAIKDDESDIATRMQEDHVIHGVVTRKNTIIHEGSRVKSAEGLLKQWSNEEPVTPPRGLEGFVDEDSPSFPETMYLERAHERHLSAGSARLLDIPARYDSQRSSMASYGGHTPERPLSM